MHISPGKTTAGAQKRQKKKEKEKNTTLCTYVDSPKEYIVKDKADCDTAIWLCRMLLIEPARDHCLN
jgi:hypothetical protein